VVVQKAPAKPGKIFVGGLKELTKEDIKAHFERFGKVLKMEMKYDEVMTNNDSC